MQDTPGIYEVLKERLEQIVGKDLLKRQVEKIVELFVTDDRIDKAILFCDKMISLADHENDDISFEEGKICAYENVKIYLQSLNQLNKKQ